MSQPSHEDPVHDDDGIRERRRLRVFALHLAGYFVAMAVIVPTNLFLTPETPWFVLPMVGWGSVLAGHAAFVMGLFDVFRRHGG